MNALRFVSLLLVSTVMWGCAEKKDNFMATAQGLQARTLYGPAETEYRRALKEDPTNAEAHYRLGALADRLGNTAGAEKEYRAALGVDAGYAAARTALADILVKRGVGARRGGELDQARRELEEAVTVQPGSSLARFELGATYQAAGQIDAAIREYRAALQADRDNTAALLGLGQAYTAQQRYEPAAAAFRAVLANNPDTAAAHAGLGVAAFHLGQSEQARRSFERAIRTHLIAGRRDLARQVQDQAAALLPAAEEE